MQSRFPLKSQILHVSESAQQRGACVPSGSVHRGTWETLILLCSCVQGLVSSRRRLLRAVGAVSAAGPPGWEPGCAFPRRWAQSQGGSEVGGGVAPSLPGCVTLGKSFNLSSPQFPHLYIGQWCLPRGCSEDCRSRKEGALHERLVLCAFENILGVRALISGSPRN